MIRPQPNERMMIARVAGNEKCSFFRILANDLSTTYDLINSLHRPFPVHDRTDSRGPPSLDRITFCWFAAIRMVSHYPQVETLYKSSFAKVTLVSHSVLEQVSSTDCSCWHRLGKSILLYHEDTIQSIEIP